MLSPSDRTLLLQALRPPPGYRLDRAIATSYSLDLIALLTAPLAFTFFDWEDDAGRPSADPLALLEAVRRHASRIHVFCQAGGIKLPKPGKTLLAYLEQCVIDVRAPHPEGIFHPKVWVIRYVGDEPPVRYRLLCLSRNLTFDRSWDTALVLDGELIDRERAIRANHALGDFIAALPRMATGAPTAEVLAAIEQVQDEVRRVRFELPEHFEELAFWPFGLAGSPTMPVPAEKRRLLVVSPFLSGALLERLAADRPPGVLVSRAESLAQLDAGVLRRFEKLFVLAPEADAEESDDEEVAPDDGALSGAADCEPVVAAVTGETLAGLHAKLFVMDDGWKARVWTGSANATDAAFSRNVEFLVELRGKKSNVGIDALIGDGDGKKAVLADLLKEWSGQPATPDPEEAARQQLELIAERFARDLSSARLEVHVDTHPQPADSGEQGDVYLMRIVRRGQAPAWPNDLTLRCWPSSLRSESGIDLAEGLPALVARGDDVVGQLERLSFEALTSFFAFEATLRHAGVKIVRCFVLNLPLIGAPADRQQRLLRALLHDKEQVLRLLWILLAQQELSASDLLDAASNGDREAKAWTTGGLGGFPLLEAMLEALDRDSPALDAVERLIDDLSRTDEGRALLPDGLAAIWAPIDRVRRSLRARGQAKPVEDSQ